MECLNSTVSYVVPLVANTIFKHAAYPFTAGDNIRALELATRDLWALKEDVNTVVTNAERKNGVPTNQVKEWLRQVDTTEKEAEEIHQKYQQLGRCIWNISPNVRAIYKVSRSAANIHNEVKNLCEKKATLEVITPMPPPSAQEMPASSSRSSNLDSALHYIKDDVHNNIIGIWGMGGIGKTHFLEQINNELSRDSTSMVVVIFVTCSKECSEEKVQNKIIEKLDLDKSESMEQNQNAIYKFLREKSFVLLLDDLWSRVDLKIIGIPDPMEAVGTCKRKVVLTTRSREVCRDMEVNEEIRVNVLNENDAWDLFKEKVTEETIDSNLLIQTYAKDVVKELGGLPLALITIGRAMRNKRDHNQWEHAVNQLQKAHHDDLKSSGSANQSIFNKLKFSYDNLKDDNLRQCFLHCSLWPEDYHIPKEKLVELWIGLGLIKEPKIQEAYAAGYSYIGGLQDVCLLESRDPYETIKMHDLIRDMALHIANKWIVRSGDKSHIELSDDTEKLSVMDNYEVSIRIPCNSSKLSTLFLHSNAIRDSRTLQLELFSKLTFLDLSGNELEAFPVEICKLIHLQFLNLSSNWSLRGLLPEELGTLTNLKYLLLNDTRCTFPNRVLSKLKALRVLDLRYLFKNERYHNFWVVQEELQCLPNFQALGFSFPNSSTIEFHELSKKVSVPIRWLEVSNCTERYLYFLSCLTGNSQMQNNLICIRIRRMDDVEYVKFESTSENRNDCRLGRLETLRFGYLRNMKGVIWKCLDPKDVFPRLQYLIFWECPQLSSISWVVNLPCIREIVICECKSIKQLIRIDELKNSGVEVSQRFFPSLKIVFLENNNELERISDPIITFPALEFLNVVWCDKLKKLPFKPSNLPRKLKWIQGSEEWWNNIEMEDGDNKSFLQPFFKKDLVFY